MFCSSKLDLEECLREAKIIAKEVGEDIKKAFYLPKNTENKKDPSDIVTETDRLVERKIKEHLFRMFPSIPFIGEETYNGVDDIREGVCWIVDPIDGTTNFANGIPHCAVSIGLAIDGIPHLGLVYNPIINELFWAIKGKGAYFNDQKFQISADQLKKVSDCVLITELTRSNMQLGIREMALLMASVRGVRMLGSAALNICYCAVGRGEGFVERGVYPWDICASIVILTEADGYYSDYLGNSGDKFRLDCGEIIATQSASLSHSIINLLNSSGL